MFLFSFPVMSDSLWPHGLQHARPPYSSPSPEVCPSSCPLHGDAIQPSPPLTPSSPSALDLAQYQGFSSESTVCIRCPKYWIFSFSISPSSNKYSGLISLKIDWFDLLAVSETLRSLLQHHSLKASVLWHSAFFTVPLSQLYVTTGKIVPLTIWTFVHMWTFVGRVMSLLFSTLSRFVIAFLLRSKCLMISRLNHHPEWF